jgi:hypothetical protein
MRKVWPHLPRARRRLLRRPEQTPRDGAELTPGLLAELDVDDVLERLRRDGVAVLDQRLSSERCDALIRLAHAATARSSGGERMAVTRPDQLTAPRYDLDEHDLLADREVQRLIVDPSLRALAAAYLGGEAVSDMAAMWWSVAQPGGPSSSAAQQFHTDRDRLSFVKFFIYLTDVDDAHGPHVFVRGSHQRLPGTVRADRRFDDAEVTAVYGEEALLTIGGPTGTIFVADTSGLHKVLPPAAGHRLVFQLEFTTSLFGAPYLRCDPTVLDPATLAAARARPRAYARLLAA